MKPTPNAVERAIALVLVLWSLLVLLLLARYQQILNGIHVPLVAPRVQGNPPMSPVQMHETETGQRVPYRGNEMMRLVRRLFEVGERDRRRLVEELGTDPLHVLVDPSGFRCPAALEDRLDYPDFVNHSRADAFRAGEEQSWVFYQHLRKAGGTGFCDLAKRNMRPQEIPPYYCMPDNRG